jgi:hypothetical protein
MMRADRNSTGRCPPTTSSGMAKETRAPTGSRGELHGPRLPRSRTHSGSAGCRARLGSSARRSRSALRANTRSHGVAYASATERRLRTFASMGLHRCSCGNPGMTQPVAAMPDDDDTFNHPPGMPATGERGPCSLRMTLQFPAQRSQRSRDPLADTCPSGFSRGQAGPGGPRASSSWLSLIWAKVFKVCRLKGKRHWGAPPRSRERPLAPHAQECFG